MKVFASYKVPSVYQIKDKFTQGNTEIQNPTIFSELEEFVMFIIPSCSFILSKFKRDIFKAVKRNMF